jgi:hypothetical protein
LMISSTVSALLGAMVVVLCVYEGRRILDCDKGKELTRNDDLH